MPLGRTESCSERLFLRCRRKELKEFDERTESGRKFQIVRAVALKKLALLADVVQQFAVCDESPPWSRHLD